MATTLPQPWRPGAQPLPLVEIVEQAEKWARNGMGNPMEACRLVAFSYARQAACIADAAIVRMIENATFGEAPE